MSRYHAGSAFLMLHIKPSALLLFALWLGASPLYALEPVQVGTLKFGTVNWELDTATHHGLDRKHGIAIKVTSFANKQATHIVFQSGEVDMIVTDWLWVSRLRAEGKPYRFIPYSSALGAIMVPPDSAAKDLRDLRGMHLGVAGGAYDKSWLLLRAWARKQYRFDPSDEVEVHYAAPPLLNGQIERGKLDAVLNFWHYSARLEAQGYRRLREMSEVSGDLTERGTVPMVGYVFREDWEKRTPGGVSRFDAAIREARAKLLHDDAEWERLRPQMRIENEKSFRALRDRYREGVPRPWSADDTANAERLMQVLVNIGGDKLTGGHPNLSAGTFWQQPPE